MITNELEIRIINKIGLILHQIIKKSILVLWNIDIFEEKKHTLYVKIENDIFMNKTCIKVNLDIFGVIWLLSEMTVISNMQKIIGMWTAELHFKRINDDS